LLPGAEGAANVVETGAFDTHEDYPRDFQETSRGSDLECVGVAMISRANRTAKVRGRENECSIA
jgi:hypothetical protein